MAISIKEFPSYLNPTNLSSEELEYSVVSFTAKLNSVNQNNLRLDIDAVFEEIPVKKRKSKPTYFYVGTTGGELILNVIGGLIYNYTANRTIKVNYRTTSSEKGKSTLKLSPEISLKAAGKEVKGKLGDAEYDTNSEKSFKAQFQRSENEIVAILKGDKLRWSIAIPRVEGVIRNCIFDTIPFFAEITWKSEPKSCCIKMQPSNIIFFDSNRKSVGYSKSILMQFNLWRKGIKVFFKNGIKAKFNIETDESK